ncbi:hypothetical protein HGRIS_009040 [Hohenbuehelia grisea]|uniref:Xylanolytic transcriptional activator regulatory domain-containing protein n=1 Tax=Hohenbuehelia grisea TaxID=104357 RepID=A0ABR3J010_9AGAR
MSRPPSDDHLPKGTLSLRPTIPQICIHSTHRYVEKFEARISKLEQLLQQLYPTLDLSDLDNLDITTVKENAQAYARDVHDQGPFPNPQCSEVAVSAIRKMLSPLPIPDDSDLEYIELANSIREYSNKTGFVRGNEATRFFGKSSNAMFIKDVFAFKKQVTGRNTSMATSQLNPTFASRRERYWKYQIWEVADVYQPPKLTFPEDDLIYSLVDLYFEHYNLYLPIIHRPTFEKNIAEGRHLEDYPFGSLVLLVCAVGARHSDDPRVILDGVDSFHSAGWKYFSQVLIVRQSYLPPATLSDLQNLCVMLYFLQGTSAPQSSWVLGGIAVRLAQDIGAHRRQGKGHTPSIEHEQLKRVFWALVCIDRQGSLALGRPCAIQDEDYDLDLPIECDDEYWAASDQNAAFQQPAGKPSKVAFFTSYIKLSQLLGMTLSTVYAINKSKMKMGLIGEWEEKLVSELDSALNKWVDAVPKHIRWDPNQEDLRHFRQSATLWSAYYHLQIVIHRPFIPYPRKMSKLSLPSLAICTNAARSISRIAEALVLRTGILPPQTQLPVSIAGIVLLMSIWGSRRPGFTTDVNRAINDVQKCMDALKETEAKWINVGRMWDVLHELASAGDLLSHHQPKTSDVPAQQQDPSPQSLLSSPTREDPHRIVPLHVASSVVDSPSRRTPVNPVDISQSLAGAVTPGSHSSYFPSSFAPKREPFDVNLSPASSSPFAYQPSQMPVTSGLAPSSAGQPMQVDQFDSHRLASSFTAHQGVADPSLHGFMASHQDFFSSLAMDNDMVAMWSNAPVGFE